jgi:MoaA/NifB/PqqE/SkfB family radical SAM enzyme
LVLQENQKAELQSKVDAFMKKLPGLFVAFPGDEEQYGGCLAAGRGFFHINPSGLVEPCPFAPFSDQSILSSNIKEALNSPLFKYIQENHHLLKETEGGCALWANREFIAEINKNKE